MQGNLKSELEMAGFSPDEIMDLMIQPEEVYEPSLGEITELREFGSRRAGTMKCMTCGSHMALCSCVGAWRAA